MLALAWLAGGAGEPGNRLADHRWRAGDVHPGVAGALGTEGGSAGEGHLGVLKGELRREWLTSNQPGNDYQAYVAMLGVRLQR